MSAGDERLAGKMPARQPVGHENTERQAAEKRDDGDAQRQPNRGPVIRPEEVLQCYILPNMAKSGFWSAKRLLSSIPGHDEFGG